MAAAETKGRVVGLANIGLKSAAYYQGDELEFLAARSTQGVIGLRTKKSVKRDSTEQDQLVFFSGKSVIEASITGIALIGCNGLEAEMLSSQGPGSAIHLNAEPKSTLISESRYSTFGQKRSFTSAWVSFFEQVDGEWKMTGNVSNFKPGRK